MKKLILFQGDSVTDCQRTGNPEALPLGIGYPYMVAARYQADHPGSGVEFINRGVSGNRVVDLYARWKIDALNLKPDVLSILIGVNDTWHEFARQNGVEVERAETIYRMLLEWTRRELPMVKLVLCEPFVLEFGVVEPPWVVEMKARSAMVKKLAAEYDAIFVPFQSIVSAGAEAAGDPAVILRDGVHPTLVGHQLMADAWLAATASLI